MRSVARTCAALGAAASLAVLQPCPAAADPKARTAATPASDANPWLAFVPRLGIVAYGRGVDDVTCDGSCAGFAGTHTGYVHEPAFTFGADGLFGLGRYVRVGPTLQYTLANDVDLEGNGTFEVGNDFVADAAVDGFFPLGEGWAITPRLQAGLLVLTPEGDLARHLSSLHDEFCPVFGNDCTITDGTRLGWNIAAGVGGSFRIEPHLAARLDVSFQYYSLNLYTIDATLFLNPIKASESLSGGRLMIMTGVELF